MNPFMYISLKLLHENVLYLNCSISSAWMLSPVIYSTHLLSSQAIINSTVTPNMTFTKTSQKFGQWADSRANTVYGLGFAT